MWVFYIDYFVLLLLFGYWFLMCKYSDLCVWVLVDVLGLFMYEVLCVEDDVLLLVYMIEYVEVVSVGWFDLVC